MEHQYYDFRGLPTSRTVSDAEVTSHQPAKLELHLTLNQGIGACHLLCSLRKSRTVLPNIFHLQTVLH